jgi:hypothetical protein
MLGDDDVQEKIIMIDYLFIDHVIVNGNLGSTSIKSGISAFELEEHEMIENWIQKVVEAFTKN